MIFRVQYKTRLNYNREIWQFPVQSSDFVVHCQGVTYWMYYEKFYMTACSINKIMPTQKLT